MSTLEIWYSRIDAHAVTAIAPAEKKLVGRSLDEARRQTSLSALPRLTDLVDGTRRIIDLPPLIEHLDLADEEERIHQAFLQLRPTLADDRRQLLERFRVVDLARKVVGVAASAKQPTSSSCLAAVTRTPSSSRSNRRKPRCSSRMRAEAATRIRVSAWSAVSG